MRLYKISQSSNNDYDTFSDAIICAANEQEARLGLDFDHRWCRYPEQVKVELIGEAVEGLARGIVLASFHAG